MKVAPSVDMFGTEALVVQQSVTKLQMSRTTPVHFSLFLGRDVCSHTTERSSLQQCLYQRSGSPDRLAG